MPVDFDKFEKEFATKTIGGEGFSLSPYKKLAASYAAPSEYEIRKLWGKQYVDAAIERKKDPTPILYEVNLQAGDTDILIAKSNFENQHPSIQEKIKKSEYWADEFSIPILAHSLNTKVIILDKDNSQDGVTLFYNKLIRYMILKVENNFLKNLILLMERC